MSPKSKLLSIRTVMALIACHPHSGNCFVVDLVDLLHKYYFTEQVDRECAILDMVGTEGFLGDHVVYRYDQGLLSNRSTTAFEELIEQLHLNEICIVALYNADDAPFISLNILRKLLERVPKYIIIVWDESRKFKMENLGPDYLLYPVMTIKVYIISSKYYRGPHLM